MDAMKLFSILLYFVLFIFGTIGNLLVIIYFGVKCKNKHNVTYRFYIVHLAVVDFLCCSSVPPVLLVGLLSNHSLLNTYTCKYVITFGWMTVMISAWILCGIAWDRYKAIVFPLKPKASIRYTIYYNIFCWVTAIPFMAVLGINTIQKEGGGCYVDTDGIFYKYIAIYVITEFIYGCVFAYLLNVLFFVSNSSVLKKTTTWKDGRYWCSNSKTKKG